MSERALRDELEQLSAKVKAAREQVAHNETAGAEQVLGPLREQVTSARAIHAELSRAVTELRAKVEAQEAERSDLQSRLDDARTGIAQREPPENPWGRDAPNWNPDERQGGCLQLVLLTVAGAVTATSWWLA